MLLWLGVNKDTLPDPIYLHMLLRCSCPGSCDGRALAVLEGDAGLEEVLLAPLRRMTEIQVCRRFGRESMRKIKCLDKAHVGTLMSKHRHMCKL